MIVDVGASNLDVRVTQGRSIAVGWRCDDDDTSVDLDYEPSGAVVVSSETSLDLVLGVPLGSRVVLRSFAGTATIGDVQGVLELDLEDAATVRAGRVTEADIRLRDHSTADIAQVDGRHLAVEVIGAGRLRVTGSVERAAVRVIGSGDVCVLGRADDADLAVDGRGHIAVHRVRHSLLRRIVGAGDIAVANPPLDPGS